jgi:hypothetical protein
MSAKGRFSMQPTMTPTKTRKTGTTMLQFQVKDDKQIL